MGDLEDGFLKANVPGRYSGWDGGDDDSEPRRHNSDENGGDADDGDDDDENAPFDPAALAPSTAAAPPPRSNVVVKSKSGVGGGRSTAGPKGVIADYHEARRAEELRLAEEGLERMQLWNKATNPGFAAARPTTTTIQKNTSSDSDGDSDSDSDYDDSDDDELLKEFRAKRMKQLRSASLRPTFGEISEVTPDEYADLVDSIDSRVHLIVHLYDPSVRECDALNRRLEGVARGSMASCKFVRLRALDAKPDLDVVCLPCLLVHRGGELVANIPRFADELSSAGRGGYYDEDDVREALEAWGVK